MMQKIIPILSLIVFIAVIPTDTRILNRKRIRPNFHIVDVRHPLTSEVLPQNKRDDPIYTVKVNKRPKDGHSDKDTYMEGHSAEENPGKFPNVNKRPRKSPNSVGRPRKDRKAAERPIKDYEEQSTKRPFKITKLDPVKYRKYIEYLIKNGVQIYTSTNKKDRYIPSFVDEERPQEKQNDEGEFQEKYGKDRSKPVEIKKRKKSKSDNWIKNYGDRQADRFDYYKNKFKFDIPHPLSPQRFFLTVNDALIIQNASGSDWRIFKLDFGCSRMGGNVKLIVLIVFSAVYPAHSTLYRQGEANLTPYERDTVHRILNNIGKHNSPIFAFVKRPISRSEKSTSNLEDLNSDKYNNNLKRWKKYEMDFRKFMKKYNFFEFKDFTKKKLLAMRYDILNLNNEAGNPLSFQL